MEEILSQPIKYVFLDVVGFTFNRSVEAQTDIVGSLNSVVTQSLDRIGIKPENRILLPTGDGLCLALLDQTLRFDTHLLLALEILHLLHDYNQSTSDEMRRFWVRIGINENVDNVVTDINGNRNVAGAGINLAQRVMRSADGGQVLVGQPVFETLRHRERYMKSFRRYDAQGENRVTLTVFQFIEEGHSGVSVATPAQFVRPKQIEQRLTETEALYMAHAMKHADLFKARRADWIADYAAAVLLWFLAADSLEERHASEYKEPRFRIHGGRSISIEKAFEYYMAIDFGVCCELSHYVKSQLSGIAAYIQPVGISGYHVVNDRGKAKLRAEYPEIWQAFELDSAVQHRDGSDFTAERQVGGDSAEPPSSDCQPRG